MTPSELRQARCMAAIEDAVGFLDRKADARRAAAMLIQQFQSPGAILEADLAALAPEAVGPDAAELLGFVPSLARKVWHEGGEERHPQIGSLEAASAYLLPLFIGVPIEQFFLLCLDSGGRLMRCALLQKGTLDQTPFYLGSVLQCAVTTGAHAVVLCHNHPGGSLRPSADDIQTTLLLRSILEPMGIAVLDHFIVADGQVYSMMQQGDLNPEALLPHLPASARTLVAADSSGKLLPRRKKRMNPTSEA